MKKLQIEWAELAFGTTVNRFTRNIDTDNMGFDQKTGAFLIENHDGSVDSYWNCPVRMRQSVVDDDKDNYVDFDEWSK